jgi:hypothetical protein
MNTMGAKFLDLFFDAAFETELRRVAKPILRRTSNSRLNFVALRKDGQFERIVLILQMSRTRGYAMHLSYSTCWFRECPTMNTAFGRSKYLLDYPEFTKVALHHITSGWFEIGAALTIDSAGAIALIGVNKKFASSFLDRAASLKKGDPLIDAALTYAVKGREGDLSTDDLERILSPTAQLTKDGFPVHYVARHLYAKREGNRRWFMR